MVTNQGGSAIVQIEEKFIERRGGVAWHLVEHQVATPKPKRNPRLSWNQRRDVALKNLQSLVKEAADQHQGLFSTDDFVQTFSQESTLRHLFNLFDPQGQGSIRQDEFFDHLVNKLNRDDEERAFADLLETVAYVIADDSNLNRELFTRIFQSRNVLSKWFQLIAAGGNAITANALMDHITCVTYVRRNRELTKEELRHVEDVFRQRMTHERKIHIDDFKKMIPAKNPFFAERVFKLFDKDGSGGISFAEFMESVQLYCSKSTEDKVRFIFKVYDINGDGLIRVGELKSILQACMEESGMKFSDQHLDDLTDALYEDANPQRSDGITFEQLKLQLEKHDGLLESLSINIDRWLLPAPESREKPARKKAASRLSTNYLKNNVALVCFVTCYFAINVVLFIEHAMHYVDVNVTYMLARGAGKTLNFNAAFVLVLMLRRSITALRVKGVGHFLPLDQHIYLHKLCGTVLFVMSLLHGVMHISNFVFFVADKWVVGNRTYPLTVWLFTTTPGVFGLIPGCANLTGWALWAIAFIMGICSLPFIRKSGRFEVFYWTHMLCIPFWILMIFHEKGFWRWFLAPCAIYTVELLCRAVQSLTRKGQSYVTAAVLLPSRVTHLVIKRPKNFQYQPGDYVFLKVPTIASFEWHPFTISSAPEQLDSISLHIRSAGGWTNRLHQYFETQQAELIRSESEVRSPTPPPAYSATSQPAAPVDSHSSLKNTAREFFSSQSCPGGWENSDMELMRRNCQAPCEPSEDVVLRCYRGNRKAPLSIKVSAPDPTAKRDASASPLNSPVTPRMVFAPESLQRFPRFDGSMVSVAIDKEADLKQTLMAKPSCNPLKVVIDGPYGAPSSNIFQAEHAVLIAAGIGVTPFASILQSIMSSYWNSKQHCPNCKYSWNNQMPQSIRNLNKVDFFWINREQRSFEWFVNLLTQLEIEQAEKGGVLDRFLDTHMYMTSGLQRSDFKAVALHLALDLLYKKDKRDLITGLKTRTRAGRPNWNKVFQQLQDQGKGRITVFYCGPPQLGKELSRKCIEFGFQFRKEVF